MLFDRLTVYPVLIKVSSSEGTWLHRNLLTWQTNIIETTCIFIMIFSFGSSMAFLVAVKASPYLVKASILDSWHRCDLYRETIAFTQESSAGLQPICATISGISLPPNARISNLASSV